MDQVSSVPIDVFPRSSVMPKSSKNQTTEIYIYTNILYHYKNNIFLFIQTLNEDYHFQSLQSTGYIDLNSSLHVYLDTRMWQTTSVNSTWALSQAEASCTCLRKVSSLTSGLYYDMLAYSCLLIRDALRHLMGLAGGRYCYMADLAPSFLSQLPSVAVAFWTYMMIALLLPIFFLS